jgi:hypothetical protein
LRFIAQRQRRHPKEKLMNTQQATTRATALSLAALLTFGVLASINVLATSPAPDALFTALASPADQTIVIEAKRVRG